MTLAAIKMPKVISDQPAAFEKHSATKTYYSHGTRAGHSIVMNATNETSPSGGDENTDDVAGVPLSQIQLSMNSALHHTKEILDQLLTPPMPSHARNLTRADKLQLRPEIIVSEVQHVLETSFTDLRLSVGPIWRELMAELGQGSTVALPGTDATVVDTHGIKKQLMRPSVPYSGGNVPQITHLGSLEAGEPHLLIHNELRASSTTFIRVPRPIHSLPLRHQRRVHANPHPTQPMLEKKHRSNNNKSPRDQGDMISAAVDRVEVLIRNFHAQVVPNFEWGLEKLDQGIDYAMEPIAKMDDMDFEICFDKIKDSLSDSFDSLRDSISPIISDLWNEFTYDENDSIASNDDATVASPPTTTISTIDSTIVDNGTSARAAAASVVNECVRRAVDGDLENVAVKCGTAVPPLPCSAIVTAGSGPSLGASGSSVKDRSPMLLQLHSNVKPCEQAGLESSLVIIDDVPCTMDLDGNNDATPALEPTRVLLSNDDDILPPEMPSSIPSEDVASESETDEEEMKEEVSSICLVDAALDGWLAVIPTDIGLAVTPLEEKESWVLA